MPLLKNSIKNSGQDMYTHSLFPSTSLSNPFASNYDFTPSLYARESKVDDNKLGDHDSFQQTSPAESNAPRSLGSNLSLHSLEQSLSKTVDIQLTTTDGDVVTISFKSLQESSRMAFQMDQGNSQIRAYSENQSSELDFSISISGDLDEDEQEAIHNLMKKMKKVSKEFFQGDISSAFKHAQKLGYNSQQISGFSMDLKMEESVQAVAAYKQTSMPEHDVNVDLLSEASKFLSEVEEFMMDSKTALESMADPKQSFLDMFFGVGTLFPGLETGDEKEKSEEPLFMDIIKRISDREFI